MLIVKKKVSLVFFFFFFGILLNYNLTSFFLFFKNKDYLIRLGVILTFFETITNFLNPLNIYRLD